MANATLKAGQRIKYKKESKKLKDKVLIKKNIKKLNVGKKGQHKVERGVVYLGHIPYGFYEDEMRGFFSQFGAVTRLRLARSRRTGQSKGYAFIEFKSCDVAKIAAETMNNYLMYDRLLKAQYIPPSEQHENMLKSHTTKELYARKKNREKIVAERNGDVSQKKVDEIYKNYLKKIADFKNFLDERGIEFNFKVNNPNNIPDDVSESSIGDKYNDESSDPYAVYEMDESDDDILFKVPPNVKKVLKRSSSTAALNSPKIKKLKQINGKLDKKKTLKKSKEEKTKKVSLLNGVGKKKEKSEKKTKKIVSKKLGVKAAKLKKEIEKKKLFKNKLKTKISK